jgi:hypothetical protein
VVVASLSVPQLIAWHGAMVQLGWHPKMIVGNTGTNTKAVIAQYADKGSFPQIGGGGSPDASIPVPGNKLITAFRNDIAAAGLDKDPVNYSAASMYGWVAVDALGKLAAIIKGDVNKTSLVAAARSVKKSKPIDVYGVFKWAPGAPGPAAAPRFRNGTGWAHKWDAQGQRWVMVKAVDTWKILGYKLP